jgi:hypothetical protein
LQAFEQSRSTQSLPYLICQKNKKLSIPIAPDKQVSGEVLYFALENHIIHSTLFIQNTMTTYQYSLLSAVGNAQFRARINALTASSEAGWGKMNAAQMLAHCQEPLKIMLGDYRLRRGIIGILLGGITKKRILGEQGFGKSWQTHPGFVVRDYRVFEEEREKLLALLERIEKGGSSAISREPHPFFGVMTPHEYDMLQSKHLDHHLRQFGV